ncbi:hypothetical protein EDB87DRAFT_1418010 [Lactarius vividus]|nr:hypothetical protein EDB87DRAFT_1418010 [Lactarius vividus]
MKYENIVTSSTETLTSAPLSFTPPFAAVAIRHNPDLPRSPSSPVLNSSDSHRLIIVTAALNPSPRLTSASDLAASAEDDGGPEPGSRKGKGVLDLPSVSRATRTNTMTPDLPPQSPLLPLDTDSNLAVASPSLQTDRTGDHSSHPSHCRCDIV